MIRIIPGLFSLRVQYEAIIRMRMVTGMAAIVRPNSASFLLSTMTTNWMVKPRKKKKSNLRRAT